jgi:hypothetical protein
LQFLQRPASSAGEQTKGSRRQQTRTKWKHLTSDVSVRIEQVSGCSCRRMTPHLQVNDAMRETYGGVGA